MGNFDDRQHLYRGRRLDEDQQQRAASGAGSRPRRNHTPGAVGASPVVGGEVVAPAVVETVAWPDPDAVLTRVAADGPPRLAALAGRLSHRLATQPAHHTNNGNGNSDE